MPRFCLRLILLIAAWVIVLSACTRPLDRPLSGAQPGDPSYTPAPIGQVQPPPTLAPPTVVPLSPGDPAAPATPTPPAGGNPILRDLEPAPDAEIAAGEVRVAAQIVGFSDLVEVKSTLDGDEVPVHVAGADQRRWTAFFSRDFAPGRYEVRIVATDDQGRAGGYRWQFSVVEAESPGSIAERDSSATSTPHPS